MYIRVQDPRSTYRVKNIEPIHLTRVPEFRFYQTDNTAPLLHERVNKIISNKQIRATFLWFIGHEISHIHIDMYNVVRDSGLARTDRSKAWQTLRRHDRTSRKIFGEIIVDRAQTAVTTKTVYSPHPLNVCTGYLCISFFGQFVTLNWRIHGQTRNISMSRKVRKSRISVARLLSSRVERYTQVCREGKRKSKIQVPCTLSYKL